MGVCHTRKLVTVSLAHLRKPAGRGQLAFSLSGRVSRRQKRLRDLPAVRDLVRIWSVALSSPTPRAFLPRAGVLSPFSERPVPEQKPAPTAKADATSESGPGVCAPSGEESDGVDPFPARPEPRVSLVCPSFCPGAAGPVSLGPPGAATGGSDPVGPCLALS